MRANLHLHSLRSDGTLSPAGVAEASAAVGLEAAVLTDHDTLGGVPEFLDTARSLGLTAWAGVEIDVADRESGYRSEILAYFPSGRYEATRTLLARVAERRRERARCWMAKAPEVFFRPDLSYEDLIGFKAEGLGPGGEDGEWSLSKTDLFRYLLARKALPSSEYKEFKKAYFDTNLLPSGSYRKTELEEAVRTVLDDGGCCSIPHPGHEFGDSLSAMRKGEKRLGELLRRMRALGVRGLEIYHYGNADSDGLNRFASRAALAQGYFLTCGSDCHGPGSVKYTIRDFRCDFAGWPKA